MGLRWQCSADEAAFFGLNVATRRGTKEGKKSRPRSQPPLTQHTRDVGRSFLVRIECIGSYNRLHGFGGSNAHLSADLHLGRTVSFLHFSRGSIRATATGDDPISTQRSPEGQGF